MSFAETEQRGRSSAQRKSAQPMSPETALTRAQDLLIQALAGKSVRIYEAGGGSVSVLPLRSFDDYRITVVDIDDVQLQQNNYADEKILGNIETYDFPPDSFDLVVCHNVIEHLPAADQAMKKFYSALAPGGLVFVSGGSTSLHALDAATGIQLWEGSLQGKGHANPMTYRTRGGRQYVVIATGRARGGELRAFALPRP